jgi:hypothetical protein
MSDKSFNQAAKMLFVPFQSRNVRTKYIYQAYPGTEKLDTARLPSKQATADPSDKSNDLAWQY